MPHKHKCARCQQQYQCEAPLKPNFDGFPDVVCPVFHEDGAVWCQLCEQKLAEDWAAEVAHETWWYGVGSDVLDAEHEGLAVTDTSIGSPFRGRELWDLKADMRLAVWEPYWSQHHG